MKTTTLAAAGIYSVSTIMAFICSYFFNLAMTNSDQYLALVGVVLADGFFGVIAGTKREGFQTFKALKVLKTLVTWIILLTVLLMVEQGFKGTSWLSETILVPFIVFQLISALKNASMSGFIDMAALNSILDKIDLHKGDRK
jgi:phage-related holin